MYATGEPLRKTFLARPISGIPPYKLGAKLGIAKPTRLSQLSAAHRQLASDLVQTRYVKKHGKILAGMGHSIIADLGISIVQKLKTAAHDPVRFGMAYALLQVPGIGDNEAAIIVNHLFPKAKGEKPFQLPQAKNPSYEAALKRIVANALGSNAEAGRDFAAIAERYRFALGRQPGLPAHTLPENRTPNLEVVRKGNLLTPRVRQWEATRRNLTHTFAGLKRPAGKRIPERRR